MRRGISSTLVSALILGFVGAAGACDRASEEECEAACLQFAKLGKAEEEGLELGSEAFDEIWAEVEQEQELEEGLFHCVQMCEGMASSDQAACVLDAESIAEAEDCPGVSMARQLEEGEAGEREGDEAGAAEAGDGDE